MALSNEEKPVDEVKEEKPVNDNVQERAEALQKELK